MPITIQNVDFLSKLINSRFSLIFLQINRVDLPLYLNEPPLPSHKYRMNPKREILDLPLELMQGECPDFHGNPGTYFKNTL